MVERVERGRDQGYRSPGGEFQQVPAQPCAALSDVPRATSRISRKCRCLARLRSPAIGFVSALKVPSRAAAVPGIPQAWRTWVWSPIKGSGWGEALSCASLCLRDLCWTRLTRIVTRGKRRNHSPDLRCPAESSAPFTIWEHVSKLSPDWRQTSRRSRGRFSALARKIPPEGMKSGQVSPSTIQVVEATDPGHRRPVRPPAPRAAPAASGVPPVGD